jgi:predicted ATPase
LRRGWLEKAQGINKPKRTGTGGVVLTRLEVDGFKNLQGFSLDFGPFTCIAGPNSVGKSNIFDVIQFLSFLTEHTLMEAALKIRGADPEFSDIEDLFRTDGNRRADDFRIAAEMIVDGKVVDDFGRPAQTSSTFLRYEIKIGYAKPSADTGFLGRLVLLSEDLNYITQGDAPRHIKFPNSKSKFRASAVRNTRKSVSGFISTVTSGDGKREIVVHQDGGSRGPGQKAPADSAPRTIVGTSNTSATPTILAARREMRNWRLLALEPSAMRHPDRFQTDPYVSVNGGHMPATLYRLARIARKKGLDPEDVHSEVATRMSDLVAVSSIDVSQDEVRQLLTIDVTEASGVRLPACSLSDGTLRFLALAIIAADPSAKGLICMEEPENGIHPAKIPAMVDLLQEIAVDPDEALGDDNPLRQVIVATHSPHFVQLQRKDDLVFALEATSIVDKDLQVEVLRCKPLEGTWRCRNGSSGVGLATIMDYLTTPPGAQLSLPGLDQLLGER